MNKAMMRKAQLELKRRHKCACTICRLKFLAKQGSKKAEAELAEIMTAVNDQSTWRKQ